MLSLRVRLLLGTALGTTAVLLASGVALYLLISNTLWADFDESLAAKARSLTVFAEQGEGGLEFELTELSLPEFEPSQSAEYYQVWVRGGLSFARSPSLHDENLDRISGTTDVPGFQTVRLPDGRPGRIVGLTFVPRQDPENRPGIVPMETTLVLGRDVIGLQTALAGVRAILIGVCLAAVAMSAGVLAWVVHRSLKPIEHLSFQIANVGASDLSARIDAAGVPKELSPVVDRLNDMLARLEAAFERERRFTGDVAHELRTPLAGLRAQLELALSRDRAAEGYRKTLGDCLTINLQMQSMVENLLHLARADAGQLDVRRETVDVSEIIQECWERVEERANKRGLSVDWHLGEPRVIETDREKLRLVVQNVLENAVSYTNDKGDVSLSTVVENGRVAVRVGNTGSKLTADEVHHVFDRFWRADASHRPGHEGHFGLGLALCRTIMERLGGSIEASADAGFFAITIRLPGG